MKLLIADDDRASSGLLDTMTCKWGYDPIVVANGELAWELMQQEYPPRILLIDWGMPKLNGLELCQRIRSQSGSNPAYIIMLTARAEPDDIVAGLDMGANDYITKPFNSTELQARLQVGKRMLSLQQELNQANDLLAFRASHDVLTGLFNRRAIMEALSKEVSRSFRQNQDLCIALIDIDFFKQVNDSYGHLTGDHVLSEIAQRISTQLRPYDVVGRYGGEEFLLLFNSSIEGGNIVLERIRIAIANTCFNYQQNTLNVTISSGFTIFNPSEGANDNMKLIDIADKALYMAKEGGRNKVFFLEKQPL